MKRINALTIAGTDPSGGGGFRPIFKTFSALGAYGCSVITALVAQNTRRTVGIALSLILSPPSLDSVFSDVRTTTH